jgi:hypothetical protein
MASPHGNVRLELELSAIEPIAGTLKRPGGGAPLPFAGWIALCAAIEAACSQNPQEVVR